MIRLIYVSSATRVMSDNELRSLLEQSKLRNTRQAITGVLLYIAGNFIQILEGSRKDVDLIFQSIAQDPRHKGLIVMDKDEIEARTFPDWSMGFRHLKDHDYEELEGFTDFLDKDITPEQIANRPDYAVEMLYLFKKANR